MKDTTDKGVRQLHLAVEGMTCAACVSHVEGALKGVRGISSAQVNLATERATVEVDSDVVSLEELLRAVDDAGYAVTVERTNLNIGGMTCAACVSHVEKALKEVDGVVAVNVNLATEKAAVEYIPGVALIQDFREAVDDAGYTIEGVSEDDYGGRDELERLARVREISALRNKLTVSAVLAAVIFLGSFHWFPWVSGLMDRTYYPFLLWALATPVQFWAGWAFYTSGFGSLRHRVANMHTLIALGTSVAYGYSVAVVFIWALSPETLSVRGMESSVYFETSAIIITLILLGRFLEARAKVQTSQAIRRLMELRPNTARVVRDGQEEDLPVDMVIARRRHSGTPRREDSRGRRGSAGILFSGRVHAHRREYAGGEIRRLSGIWGHHKQGRHVPFPRHQGGQRYPPFPDYSPG